MGGRRQRGRAVDGVVLLDKPVGLTSNQALQRCKRLFGARKAGHTGSLDPLASGLLPVCFGQATKISPFLLDADKHYLVRCRLGIRTDTGDAEGEQIEQRLPVPPLERDALEAVLQRFTGCLMQVPPMHSAIKHQGKRLYELARAGIEVERSARPIKIHELRLLDLGAEEIGLEVRCSKGTYVRTLVEDIAGALGTLAHVSALRRVGVGPYDGDGMHTLDEIERAAGEEAAALDRMLLPLDSAIAQWPSVQLGRDSAYYLTHGQPVLVPQAPSAGWVRLYGADARFLGMGEIMDDGRVAPKRLFN